MMTTSEFWTMWSALATTIGAIATFCAVVVALWQSRLQNRKHLEVKLKYAISSPEGQHYLSISVPNRGNREVTLNGFSWKYNDGSTLFIPYQYCRFIANGEVVLFPYKLPLDSSVDILCPITLVRSALITAINEKTISEHDKIKVYVEDSLGDIYYAKDRLDVRAYTKAKQNKTERFNRGWIRTKSY